MEERLSHAVVSTPQALPKMRGHMTEIVTTSEPPAMSLEIVSREQFQQVLQGKLSPQISPAMEDYAPEASC